MSIKTPMGLEMEETTYPECDKMMRVLSSLPSGSPAGCQMSSDHDYAGAVRVGRAHYKCPKCGKDITLELSLLVEALGDVSN